LVRLFPQLLIGLGVEHLVELLHVRQRFAQGGERLEDVLEPGQLLEVFVGGSRIVPKPRLGRLYLELFYMAAERILVKDALR
jgi:hypothetical protein